MLSVKHHVDDSPFLPLSVSVWADVSALSVSECPHLSAMPSPSLKVTVLVEAEMEGGSGGRDGKYASTITNRATQMAASAGRERKVVPVSTANTVR